MGTLLTDSETFPNVFREFFASFFCYWDYFGGVGGVYIALPLKPNALIIMFSLCSSVYRE